jgi:hypothetical protein
MQAPWEVHFMQESKQAKERRGDPVEFERLMLDFVRRWDARLAGVETLVEIVDRRAPFLLTTEQMQDFNTQGIGEWVDYVLAHAADDVAAPFEKICFDLCCDYLLFSDCATPAIVQSQIEYWFAPRQTLVSPKAYARMCHVLVLRTTPKTRPPFLSQWIRKFNALAGDEWEFEKVEAFHSRFAHPCVEFV